MKRLKCAILLMLGAVSTITSIAAAQESVEVPAEQTSVGSAYVLRPRVNAAGALVGDVGTLVGSETVRTLPNLAVSLVHKSEVVARVMTNVDGEFSFPMVEPGVYTAVASNPKVLAVATMVVGPHDEAQYEPLHLIAANPLIADRRRAMMVNVQGLADPGDTIEYRPKKTTYRATVLPDGIVHGTVLSAGLPAGAVDMTGVVVRVFRNGEPVGEAIVAADGRYTLTGMSAGELSVVGFGPQGFASFAIQLTASTPVAAKANSGVETLASAIQDHSELDFELAHAGDVQAGASAPGDSFVDPFGGLAGGQGMNGTPWNVGSGSGGGGGGGGGVGGIGVLGAAAAAIAAGSGGGGFVPTASTDGGGT